MSLTMTKDSLYLLESLLILQTIKCIILYYVWIKIGNFKCETVVNLCNKYDFSLSLAASSYEL